MKKNKLYLVLSLAFLMPLFLQAQTKISGKVLDALNGKALSGANIIIKSSKQGTITNEKGSFSFETNLSNKQIITVSYLGYETVKKNINIKEGKNIKLNFLLNSVNIEAKGIVVTATKTKNRIEDVPVRVELISPKQIESNPTNTIDDVLKTTSGVYVDRAEGIFSHGAIVSMRGVGGSEQSRVLVMVDGIPVNKLDGGSVNWNRINSSEVKNIEISKGPASSLYGSNAMGGAINIITKVPTKKIEGSVSAEYGTYNTMSTKFSVGGKTSSDKDGFYWNLNGMYRSSDGYNHTPEEERDSTTVKSELEEYAIGTKVGYKFNELNSVEAKFNYFDDMRGTGVKIYNEDGCNFQHKTYSSSVVYKGGKNKTRWNAIAYYSIEPFYRYNESIKKTYTVDSDRKDYGALFNVSQPIGNHNLITSGIDLKQGSVDASDNYITSTDIVWNKGKMNTFAYYLQDEVSLFKEKVKIIAGLRYDYAKFFDGAYYLENSTNATSILESLVNDNLDEASWSALSPKLSAQYRFNKDIRVYVSYSKGFRPAILDDMCRSGFIAGGFKIANPDLEAETLDNIELGADFHLSEKLRISPSVYYSLGDNYMYYVSTGDSIAMGTKIKPIRKKENISKVKIYGAELAVNYTINNNLTAFANYNYNSSKIDDYEFAEGEDDITGNYLTYVPKNVVSLGVNWLNRFVNVNLLYQYRDDQYTDDLNSEDGMIKAYSNIDVKVWKNIDNFKIGLNVINLTDQTHVESHGNISIGRFITGQIAYRF